MVEVVCPQCTTMIRAQPGVYARCPNCGYAGGAVPGPEEVQLFAPPQEFMPADPIPKEPDDDEEPEAPAKELSRPAFTALVLGLAGIIPFAPPFAIGFAIAGLVHVSKNPDTVRGKGYAVIGLVFGVLFMTAWFLAIVFGLSAVGTFF